MEKVKLAVTKEQAIDIIKKALKKQELLREYLEGKISKKELEKQGIRLEQAL